MIQVTAWSVNAFSDRTEFVDAMESWVVVVFWCGGVSKYMIRVPPFVPGSVFLRRTSAAFEHYHTATWSTTTMRVILV